MENLRARSLALELDPLSVHGDNNPSLHDKCDVKIHMVRAVGMGFVHRGVWHFLMLQRAESRTVPDLKGTSF